MKSLFGKLIPVIFICAFLFTSFSIFTIFSNVSTLQQTESLVDHTRIVENAINQLLIHLLTIETQQRSFLLNGTSSVLETYKNNLQHVDQQLTQIEQLTKNSTTQQKNIKDLRKKINSWTSELNQEIYLNEKNPGINTSAIEQQIEIFTKQIQDIMSNMKTQEENLLLQRESQTQREYKTIYTNVGLTFVGNILIILITFYFLRREFQERTEIERAKDDFINLASHELNTPITSLKIFTRVLRSKIDREKIFETKKYLDKIDEQTNKLTMLITDLLDISRIQTGKISINKEHFHLSSLVSETVEGIQGTTHIHTIKTKQEYGHDIFADRYRLYQVVVNLLTNAIKYSPKGGTITVYTKKSGGFVIVSVSDEGIGIDKRYQQKIFDRLYQVTEVKEKTFPGLGIGLFISKEIIDMHGGTMWVKSEKGKGSTFYFSIPV